VHFGFDLAQPERRYCDASNAERIHFQTDVASGVGVRKKTGSGGMFGTLVLKMAGFAAAIAVLTSCAGGGNIQGPASPSR